MGTFKKDQFIVLSNKKLLKMELPRLTQKRKATNTGMGTS